MTKDPNPEGCAWCGSTAHFAGQCRTWVDCDGCGRPGHPFTSNYRERTRGGALWACLDCRDPQWRHRLSHHDPRRRNPDQPVYPSVAAPVTQGTPASPSEDSLRALALQQVAESRKSRPESFFPEGAPGPHAPPG